MSVIHLAHGGHQRPRPRPSDRRALIIALQAEASEIEQRLETEARWTTSELARIDHRRPAGWRRYREIEDRLARLSAKANERVAELDSWIHGLVTGTLRPEQWLWDEVVS